MKKLIMALVLGGLAISSVYAANEEQSSQNPMTIQQPRHQDNSMNNNSIISPNSKNSDGGNSNTDNQGSTQGGASMDSDSTVNNSAEYD